ncbi:MAG: UMP kinase [Gammaproteobacteria bacterium]|nr:MAG: UMP kinase [Gammaproteobacteria bacterium]
MSQYSRILLKLSGEALLGPDDYGINTKTLDKICQQIKQIHANEVQIAIVIGAGNIFRGIDLQQTGLQRVTGDNMGMLATMINSLAIKDTLLSNNIDTKIMSSFFMPNLFEAFNAQQAKEHLSLNKIVIFAGGTGNPFFSTDSAAAIRAIEIDADVLIKATKVDGVYDKDPSCHNDAKKYDKISYDEVMDKNLKVMDLNAVLLCRDFKMPLRVVSMITDNSLNAIINDNNYGTIVTP